MILQIVVVVFCLSVAWITYVFVGYPLLVRLIARYFGKRPTTGASKPHVAVVVSAYNEASCIEDKLLNCLDLEYPVERIRFVISSDGSTDGTNEMVARKARQDSRIVLHAYSDNRGKTASLAETVRHLPENIEIIVFSDANAMYHRDAVQKLVRSFADPLVGCVCGELRYRTNTGEASYRSWENRIRQAQSSLGIPPSAEGSIFAIRRGLMPALPLSVMEDLVIPYRIAAAGARVVWEPLAISEESFTLDISRRMARRKRIVNRAMRALPHIPFAWNPFASGWVAFHFISHRILRWLAPFALLAGWLSAIAIGLLDRDFLWLSTVAVASAASIGVIAYFRKRGKRFWRIVDLPTEFVLANISIMLGVISALTGNRIERWMPSR